MVKDKINNWYEKCDAGVYVGFDIKKNYDLMFATGWQTVEFVRKLPAKKLKSNNGIGDATRSSNRG